MQRSDERSRLDEDACLRRFDRNSYWRVFDEDACLWRVGEYACLRKGDEGSARCYCCCAAAWAYRFERRTCSLGHFDLH